MKIRIYGTYKHYKGRIYRVLDVAQHTEREDEKLVIYQSTKDHTVWARPLEMFFENVTLEDGTVVPRFEYLGGGEFDYDI